MLWRASRRPLIDARLGLGLRLIGATYLFIMVGNPDWFSIALLTHGDPYFAWPNIVYFLSYPFLLSGLLLLSRPEPSRADDWKHLIDAAIVLLGLSLLVWYFISRILSPDFTDPLKLAQTLAYPAVDLLLIGTAATVWFRRSAVQQRAIGFLLSGIAINATADIVYQIVYFHSGVLYSEWSDGMFIVGCVCLLWGAELYLRRPLLAVGDTGRGMDDEILNRVFEPFFTTKDRGKGTGLGLTSVYGIVRQSGGSITVENGEGERACFVIYLPRESGVALQEPVARTGAVQPGSGTILLPEDEAALPSVAKQILQNVGYTVRTAPSAEDALDLAAGQPGKIDLLLTDVIMPGESEATLAAHLNRRCPRLRGLFMSGYAGDELGVHGVLEPRVKLLQKPFTAQDLISRVREAMASPGTAAPG